MPTNGDPSYQLDFESYRPSDTITLPIELSGFTLSAGNGNYVPWLIDAAKEFTVLGPRSQGLYLATPAALSGYLKVSLSKPKRLIWISAIKTHAAPVFYSLKGEDGKEFNAGSIAFAADAPIGTYRTFPISAAGPNRIKTIEFNGSNALLARLVAAD